jgi:hypothetical protein
MHKNNAQLLAIFLTLALFALGAHLCDSSY